MSRQDTRLESEGAEFLVLGNLLIEGIPAYKAYTNMRDYDLVAVWPETNRSARIQVKSRWATDARFHLIGKIDCDFVVLARLNRGQRFSGRAKREQSTSISPEFYVLPAAIAEDLKVDKETSWGKILWDHSSFEKFRSQWDLIRDFLRNGESASAHPHGTLNRARNETIPSLDVQGAFIRRTNLSGASLRGANLSQADASCALFRDADFEGARLVGTILRGADLTGAVNVTEEQLADAVIDEHTRLPGYIDRAKLLEAVGASR